MSSDDAKSKDTEHIEKKQDVGKTASQSQAASATPSQRNSKRESLRESIRLEAEKRKPSLFRRLLPLLIILAVAGIGYYLWATSQETGFGPGFTGGNGRLEATEIDISTKLAGRIVEIKVDEGDFVTKGQELAIMQLDVLEAQLNEAQAQVYKARAGEISAQAQVALRQSDLVAAQATVSQRQSELEQTRRRLKRSTVLSERGVITGQQFDDDETTEMAAKAAVDTAQAQIGVAQASVEAAKADAQGAAATTKAAQASVASIQADIRDSHLTSPRDGRVQYRVAQPGEVLAVGGKVLNFVDLSDVYMNFFLPAGEAGKLEIGAEARIVLDAIPEYPLPAKITFVASVAQFTPKTVETQQEREKLMFRVKAKVDPELLKEHLEYVKTGLPGVAWVKLDPQAQWPQELTIKNNQ